MLALSPGRHELQPHIASRRRNVVWTRTFDQLSEVKVLSSGRRLFLEGCPVKADVRINIYFQSSKDYELCGSACGSALPKKKTDRVEQKYLVHRQFKLCKYAEVIQVRGLYIEPGEITEPLNSQYLHILLSSAFFVCLLFCLLHLSSSLTSSSHLLLQSFLIALRSNTTL
ncbi:hypothetical protein BT96DRAFT_1010995 [Gymnopus androsaceus JB14]|uniref:Uncharacterized protein n=1 Tax=Gymnopus androsaceus JB14 TaxID=1447944 RepID=A0A6A4G9V7_9AGAR|nr:hypothetical protein BT96DRAFT_1010995 [Gymnopus androsaceus JB14]